MIIDTETYRLKEDHYFVEENEKNLIVIGNSFSDKLNHFTGWLNRHDGKYKKTAHYTISRKGEVYEHFNPKHHSNFLKNKKVISIVLENKGWLKKDLKSGEYFDWIGNIYKRRVKVLEKRWRGQQYWDVYTQKQLNSTIKLVRKLCEDYNIQKKCVAHNTFINEINDFNGVAYRSNFYKDNTDVNPSWNFKEFKDKIEKK